MKSFTDIHVLPSFSEFSDVNGGMGTSLLGFYLALAVSLSQCNHVFLSLVLCILPVCHVQTCVWPGWFESMITCMV